MTSPTAAYQSVHLCEPFPQSNTLVKGWKRGEFVFHLKVGLRAGLPGGEAAEFCADLKYSSPAPHKALSELAVPSLYRLPREALGQEVNGLKRPVFVEVVQFRKDDQGVKRACSCGVVIGLRAPDNCRICTPNTGQAGGSLSRAGEGVIKVFTRFRYGERDRSPLPAVQRRGRGATARDHGPGEIVKSAPVVVRDGAESQTEPGRRRRDVVEREDEPVTLRVVVTPNGVQPLKVLVVDELLQVMFEKFGFSYRQLDDILEDR